jgi:hypothetical protein
MSNGNFLILTTGRKRKYGIDLATVAYRYELGNALGQS